MDANRWLTEFPGAVTVCDADGVILDMNERSAQVNAADGGRARIGTNLLDCHPEPARSKLVELLAQRRTNAYTIEKRGVKKLVYQAPWTEGGRYAGFVELSLAIPFAMPHFVRASAPGA